VNRLPRSLIYGSAATLCLLAPFLVFVTTNDYPVFAPEVLPLHLAWLVAGLLVAALVELRLELVARAALWCCLFLAIALLYEMSFRVLAIIAVLCAIAIGLLRDNAAIVLMVAAGLHVAATAVISMPAFRTAAPPRIQSPMASAQPRGDLPPVVYLMLDEFAGLRGLPSELPGSQPLRSWFITHYREEGFDLASHAYSQYMNTADSLANLFNFTSEGTQSVFVEGTDDAFVLTSNRFFEHLSKVGYALQIHQSSYLDFCGSPGADVATCDTYTDNSIESISGLDFPNTEKTRFILNSYLDAATFLRRVRRFYVRVDNGIDIELPAWPTGNSRVGPLALLPVMDEIESELRELKSGEFHFAHLLLPHSPYVFSADCSVKPTVRSWLATAPFELEQPMGDQNDDASRAERYIAYMAQIRCTDVLLDRLFDAIRESGQWEQCIIVIHGDHGSRIVRRRLTEENLQRLTEDDYRDAYSTFFAVKNADSSGRLITQPLPLQALLADAWELPVQLPDSHHVYLEKRNESDYFATPLRGFEQ
jgi:hypothetical protein